MTQISHDYDAREMVLRSDYSPQYSYTVVNISFERAIKVQKQIDLIEKAAYEAGKRSVVDAIGKALREVNILSAF